MARMMIPLEVEEKQAIIDLAKREKRDPLRQAGLLIRQALEHAGALPAAEQPPVEDGELEENTTPLLDLLVGRLVDELNKKVGERIEELVSMNLAQDRQIADLYSRIKAPQERVDDLEFELAKIRKEGDK